MKQLKRVLALVLVAATLCSFALAAAPAATVKYTDAGSIKHSEAVDVLSALGVIQGYKNGSFKPTASVTRAEMAKMLAVLLNKGTDPGEGYTEGSLFTDTLDHWGRTYIGFCVAEGLINGKSATKFVPDGKVTGTEAAKMLLCALGYNASSHGLTGPQWESNTVGLAMKEGCKLFEGIDAAAVYKSLSRDDACQIMLNALKADTVDCLSNGNNLAMTDNPEVGAIVIDFGCTDTKIGHIATEDYRQGGGADAIEQLCERLFPGLKLQVGITTDIDGAPASQWNNNGKALGVYQASAPVYTSEYGATPNKVMPKVPNALPESVSVTISGRLADTCTIDDLKALESSVIPNATSMSNESFVSFLKAKSVTAPGDVNKVTSGRYAAALYLQLLRQDSEYVAVYNASGNKASPFLGFNANRVNVYYNETTKALTWSTQQYYALKVTAYRPAVLDDEGNELQKAYAVAVPLVTVPSPMAPLYLNDTDTVASSSGAIAIDVSLLDDPESVEKGCCLGVRFGWDAENGGYVVRGGSILEIVDVTVDSYNESRTAKSGKTSYYRGGTVPSSLYTTLAVGKSFRLYNLVCESRTFYMFLEPGGTSAADYFYVISGGENKDQFSDQRYGANVINMKGEQSTVITKANYGLLGSALTGGFVTYIKESDDSYTFSAAGTKGAGIVDIRSGRSAVTINECNTVTGNPTGMVHQLSADDKTLFLVELPDAAGNPTYTAYTGMNKVPSLKTTSGNYSYYAYSLAENGNLAAMYVGSNLEKIAAAAGNYGTLFIVGDEQQQVDENTRYYPVTAIVEGKEETLKISANLYPTLGRGFYLFNSCATNEFGVVDSIERTSGYAFTNLVEPNAGVIGLDGDYLTYTTNTLCYTYSVGQKRLSVSTVDAIYKLNNGYQSFYTVNQEYPNIVATLAAVID